MKASRFFIVATIFTLVSCGSVPTQEEIEQGMIHRSFSLSDYRANMNDPNHEIKEWLISADKKAKDIQIIDANKNMYEWTRYSIRCGDHILYQNASCPIYELWNITKPPVESAPKTAKFESYLNNYYSQLDTQYKKLRDEIVALAAAAEKNKSEAEEARRQQDLAAGEARSRKQKEQEQQKFAENQKKNKEREQQLAAEVSKYDGVAKRLDHQGFLNITIFDFIRKTQRAGNLSDYLGYVIGCTKFNFDACENWYSDIRIIQVLEGGSIYAFSGDTSEGFMEFVVYIEKEYGKIYQDDQQLSNEHYVFKGIFSYKTVLGSTKSVPKFGRVNYSNIILN